LNSNRDSLKSLKTASALSLFAAPPAFGLDLMSGCAGGGNAVLTGRRHPLKGRITLTCPIPPPKDPSICSPILLFRRDQIKTIQIKQVNSKVVVTVFIGPP